ncbi:MAG: 1-deoxy-D-xylulose-5-phosphate reductoisomerase [Candidatus Zixiibacteriota bacterium]
MELKQGISVLPDMNPRQIVILGSTGSIGRSTLKVIDAHPGYFQVRALAAHANTDLLLEQYLRYRPELLAVVDSDRGKKLAEMLADEPVKVLTGDDGLLELMALDRVDIVLNAVVGAAGLKASLETVKSGRDLALANKESLVSGGSLFPRIIEKTKAKILPVDSEHSAVWQVLATGKKEEIKNIILTASGGPFRDYPAHKFHEITPEQALAHPTWKMGPKITIDSATLVNKGLEVIEAVVLFEMPPEKIKVVVHPQSVIHSMVEYVDSSVIAQLSNPDMCLPITYALFWPNRVKSAFGAVDWASLGPLTFELPDFKKFPALKIAYEVARTGGTAPAIFNAANEFAVAAFLEGHIKFSGITDMIENTLGEMEITSNPQLDDILEADRRARVIGTKILEKIEC